MPVYTVFLETLIQIRYTHTHMLRVPVRKRLEEGMDDVLRKTRRIGAFIALLGILAISGCAKLAPTEEPTATPAQTEEPSVSVGPLPSVTAPPVTKEPDYANLSPTTGLEWHGNYTPILVQIVNGGKDARPQWNIQLADIVYETQIDGYYTTRFTALFSDHLPDKVGPIRSSRIPHWTIKAEWGAPYAYAGGQRKAGTSIDDFARANGLDRGWDSTRASGNYFVRDKSRVMPNNLYTNLQKLLENYPDQKPEPRPLDFAKTPVTAGVAEKSFSFYYLKKEPIEYIWQEAGHYLRLFAGEPFMDGVSGEQVKVTNVILQHAKHSYYNGELDRPVIDLIGSGEAEYHINGHRIMGSWSRADLQSPTIYLDEEGKPIELMPGNTWIQIIRTDMKVESVVA